MSAGDSDDELAPPSQPVTALSVYVMIPLGESITDNLEIFQNVMARVQERSPVQSFCNKDGELFIRLYSSAQLERLFKRLEMRDIMAGSATLRYSSVVNLW